MRLNGFVSVKFPSILYPWEILEEMGQEYQQCLYAKLKQDANSEEEQEDHEQLEIFSFSYKQVDLVRKSLKDRKASYFLSLFRAFELFTTSVN